MSLTPIGFSGRQLAVVGKLTDVDTTQRNDLGARTFDLAGNEYIYLQGAASVAIGTAVTYNSAYLAARTVTGAKGPVGFAMAAIVASTFGWFLINGSTTTAVYAGAAVNGAKLYSAGTGTVDDAVVAGDQIDNAIVGATVAGAGAGAVFCQYPFMNGQG